MKKTVWMFLALVMLIMVSVVCTGCFNKNAKSDRVLVDTAGADTMVVDTLEKIISETPMPKAADELFDDFFFNFAANRKLQFKRILFPLKVYKNGKFYKSIQKKQWKVDHYFMHQGYYTLILDDKKQFELPKDTNINDVVVEKIDFENNNIRKSIFNRMAGEWKLVAVDDETIEKNNNSSFLKFYAHFSKDSIFQIESMNEEVLFTSIDPDDDFNTQTGSIFPEQWPSFKPGLIPSGVIFNILYGKRDVSSNHKIFVVRGISNGLEEELIFKKKSGKWKLMKFNG